MHALTRLVLKRACPPLAYIPSPALGQPPQTVIEAFIKLATCPVLVTQVDDYDRRYVCTGWQASGHQTAA